MAVIVTGAAKGIGAATARRFAKDGANVILSDRDVAGGEALAAEIGATFQRADVTVEAEVAALVDTAVALHGRLDVIVNNAGLIGATGSIAQTSDEHWRRTMAVLLDGVFYGVKHAARVMQDQRSGVILSISSAAGIVGGLGPHAYTVAKHGVVGLTRTAASELSQYGIRVNAVAPGQTITPMIVSLRGGESEAVADAAAQSALGTAIDADEIADTLAWLASESARHVTGQVIAVDSGLTTSGIKAARYHNGESRFVGG